MIEMDLWSSYQVLHRENPGSDNAAKVDFYSKNSEFITRNSQNPNPKIAIIIPAFNESSLIPRSLASINQILETNKDTMVLVVDNNSIDETAEIAKFFGAKIIKEPKKGIGEARQSGLEAVPPSVKHILTTDADTVVPLNWLNAHKSSLEHKNTVFTYGEVNFIPDLQLSSINRFLLFGYTKTANFIHTIKNNFGIVISGGSNSGLNKDIALFCGGYNRNLKKGEDTDIMTRISKYGDTVKINSPVITSARRITNEGIIRHGFKRFHDNIIHCLGYKESLYSESYKDYR